MGGGSSINAEIYTRGCPEDYDNWATQHDCEGWSWRDLKPFFIRSEGNARLGGADHGIDGPLAVSDLQSPTASRWPMCRAAWTSACRTIRTSTPGKQEGAGLYQTTTRDGRRCSAAVGYLRPVMGRKNLQVRTDLHVSRIIVENGRAVGVEVLENGALTRIDAAREVIVTAGAIGSPKLLMLSGIGRPIICARWASRWFTIFGRRPELPRSFLDRRDLGAERSAFYDKYKKRHWQAWAGLQYAMFRSGPVASNIVEAGAFWWSDRSEKTPDLQFHFLAGAGVEEGVGTVPGGNGATCNTYHVRPRSRGEIRLRSSNPTDAPLIDPNSFAEPYDLERHIDGIRITQEVGRSRAMSRFVAAEHFPGPGVKTRDDYIACARTNARSPTIPSAPARWAATRWRWSTRSCGCAAFRGCASATVRSCRRSYPPTPMLPPSPLQKRPRI